MGLTRESILKRIESEFPRETFPDIHLAFENANMFFVSKSLNIFISREREELLDPKNLLRFIEVFTVPLLQERLERLLRVEKLLRDFKEWSRVGTPVTSNR